MMQDRLIEIGQIVAPIGIKGEMKVNSLIDVAHFKSYKEFYNQAGDKLTLTFKRAQKKQVIIALDTVHNRNEAEMMRGVCLYIKRSQMPKENKDSFYICDLIGLDVLQDNQKIGRVGGIENYGASDIMQIRLENGTEKLIAMSKETILDVDLEKKQISVWIPKEIEDENEV